MTKLRDIPGHQLPAFRDGSPRINASLLRQRCAQAVKRFDGYFMTHDEVWTLRAALRRELLDFLRAAGLSDDGWTLEPYPLDGRWLLFGETSLPDGGAVRDEKRLTVEPGGLTILGKNARGEHCLLDELPGRLRASR